MADNYAETFFQTSPFWQMAGEQYVPGSMDDPFSDTGIQQPLHYEIPQIGPTGHNTEQDSGLSQANMVGTDVTAAVTGRPGQKRNDPWHGNRIQRSLVHEIMQIGPTGHNTEQGSVSGLPQANMVETEVTAAVPGRPGQKRKPEITAATRSKNFRAKKKKEVDEMKEKMDRLQEKNKRLKKDNKKLNKNLNEYKRNLDDQLEKMHGLKETLAESKKANNDLQILTTSLSQTVENMSSLPEEIRMLQADKDRLMQLVNAGTNENNE